MSHAYTEDQLVEQPAIGLFAKLGWTTVSALEETFGAGGTLLRETKGEQELYPRQSPQLLKALREMALVQSVESSNRIEGVTVAPARKTVPSRKSQAIAVRCISSTRKQRNCRSRRIYCTVSTDFVRKAAAMPGSSRRWTTKSSNFVPALRR